MSIETTKSGRTILSGREYSEFRKTLWQDQRGRCAYCNRPCLLGVPFSYNNAFNVHHKNGRGLGGGKRDDTPESCVGICNACHKRVHKQ